MTAVVTGLRAEYRHEALGVATPSPRLSWSVADASSAQVAYEIRLRSAGSDAVVELVESPSQSLVPWPFPALESRQAVEVEVRSQDVSGAWSEWSEPLAIEGALYAPQDWREPWIVPSEKASHDAPRPAYLLRAAFSLDSRPVSARLHVTAQGVFEASVNGAPVSDEILAPGWTTYPQRLRSRTHDVTGLLGSGENVLGIELADGWFRGRIGFHGGLWDVYGEHVSVRAQLEVTDASGQTSIVHLGDAWRMHTGPATGVGLYDGERYDARLERDGWSAPGFDAGDWVRPQVWGAERVDAAIEPAVGPPVRAIETIAPVEIERRDNGRYRLDFGQNISGLLRIRLDAPEGHTVTLHHAEVIENGELGTRPLRTAWSVDSYTSRGDGPVEWQPRFTIHGFRYAEVENWPGELTAEDVVAVSIHSDMERRGWFECSNPLLNQLHSNTVWSMRDNFVDLPTDCPQRDERLGWTGDIQVFAPAALYLYEADGVLASWLRDVALEQGDDGWVPNFVPWVACGFPEPSSAAWGDAAVIVPWTMYQRRGDVGILAEQYPSMTAWIDYHASRVGPSGVVEDSFELGDWLDPAAPPDNPGLARTDKFLVSSAYLVKSSRIVAEVATLLGKQEESERYAALADRVAEAVRRTWFATPDAQAHAITGMALGLEFGLVEEADARAALGDRLAHAVREGDYTVQTGFVGTPIVCDALVSTGHLEEAYGLLQQTKLPSWLYPVSMGATTIWERWDSMLPDGSINPGEMTSFNHYALGAVVDFLHRVVAGIAPTAPGYREIEIRPQPGGGLDHAHARHLSPYGPIEVEWRIADREFTLSASVPAGITATVVLPDGASHDLTAGHGDFTCTLEPASVPA